jgi:NAD-reducing hydrogenase small subunit
MSKLRLATVWLDGCSGCHMSFLDTDERLLDLLEKVDLVYSPLVDVKEYPDHADIALIEGSVSTDEDVVKIRKIRAHTTTLVALGDCAVTGNVPAMRNPFGPAEVLKRSYIENTKRHPQIPTQDLPTLLAIVKPVHELVPVDVYVPGCPPPANAILYVLTELIEGRKPDPITMTRFGK